MPYDPERMPTGWVRVAPDDLSAPPSRRRLRRDWGVGSLFGYQPQVRAVQAVDFAAALDEVVGLIAGSGSGNSTLGHLI